MSLTERCLRENQWLAHELPLRPPLPLRRPPNAFADPEARRIELGRDSAGLAAPIRQHFSRLPAPQVWQSRPISPVARWQSYVTTFRYRHRGPLLLKRLRKFLETSPKFQFGAFHPPGFCAT